MNSRELLSRHIDLFIAAFILVGSTWLSLLLYFRLFGAGSLQTQLSWQIPAGKSRTDLFQGNRCVATVETAAKSNRLYELTLKTRLSLRNSTDAADLTLAAAAFFNPMGQLIRSQFTVKTTNGDLTVKTRDVNPIKLFLDIRSGQKHYARVFSLPGPVLLKEEEDKTSFRLEYYHLKDLFPEHLITAPSSVADRLALHVAAQSSGACQGEIDISALADDVLSLSNAIEHLSPDIHLSSGVDR